MPRRKKIKIPFISSFKIKKHTLSTAVGVFFFLCGSLLVLSFVKNGSLLVKINEKFVSLFGWYSISIACIILIISTHFFNSKKLTIIKVNVSVGLILMSIAIIGISSTGKVGEIIYTNLSKDFSTSGAILILLSIAMIGSVIFLNTSIDIVLISIIKFFKKLTLFIRKHVFKQTIDILFSKKKKSQSDVLENKKQAFITDDNVSSRHFPIVRERKAIEKFQSNVPVKSSSHSDMAFHSLESSITNKDWVYPPLHLLTDMDKTAADRGDIKYNSSKIEETLDSFGIRAKVVQINDGPTVTQYAIEIAMGTKLSKIMALSNDLALALAASTGQVRIEAPIPGKRLVGIEIPNIKPELVTLKRLLVEDNNTTFQDFDPLRVPLGLDVSGNPIFSTIEEMPHALIAGTTGSGKSVMLNSWICTFLIRTRPDEVNLILVDPKRVELTQYNGIPHLLSEVIVDPLRIISALKWTVSEMESRYKLFSKFHARNLKSYNQIEGVEKKPYIIFIIDELADLMMFARSEAENLITRIAQMSRATGIHLILATQRPSVDVITGLMKANIPTRIAFNVASMIDSKVVLDTPGAEKLLGKGDMLFLPPDQAKPKRVQGPFISDKDVASIVKFLKLQTPTVQYSTEITQQDVTIKTSSGKAITTDSEGMEKDPLFDKALSIVMDMGKGSSSVLQRRLSIGYSRAARILDQLEKAGYIGPTQGSKPREVLRPVSSESVNNLTEKTVK